MTGALYLYGVMRLDKPPALPVEAGDGGVWLLVEGDLGAMVAAAPAGAPDGLAWEERARSLRKRREALAAAQSRTTVLPVRCGTVAPGAEAVRRLLARDGESLRERLDAFEDRRQMEIAVSWTLDSWMLDHLLADIAMEADGAKARRAIPDGAICDALMTVAMAVTANAVTNDRRGAGFVALLDREDVASLVGVVNRLAADFSGDLDFRCLGPLPPAHFATVDVAFPPAGDSDQSSAVFAPARREASGPGLLA